MLDGDDHDEGDIVPLTPTHAADLELCAKIKEKGVADHFLEVMEQEKAEERLLLDSLGYLQTLPEVYTLECIVFIYLIVIRFRTNVTIASIHWSFVILTFQLSVTNAHTLYCCNMEGLYKKIF